MLATTGQATEEKLMKMYEYINEFHGTAATSKYSRDDLREAHDYKMAHRERYTHDDHERAYRAGLRLKTTLCGFRECTCSNWYGQR